MLSIWVETMCGVKVAYEINRVTCKLDIPFYIQHNWNGSCLTWSITSKLKNTSDDRYIVEDILDILRKISLRFRCNLDDIITEFESDI